MQLPKAYLLLLEEYGRDLKDIGVEGFALPKQEALKAIGILANAGFPILGGDVIRVVRGRAEVSYDNWYCRHEGDPSSSEYRQASAEQAEKYIRGYLDPEDGSVLYQIVTPAPWRLRAP